MPVVGFEPTIPVFEWAKTVHAFNRAATILGEIFYTFLVSTLTRCPVNLILYLISLIRFTEEYKL
jgi:hypothetical protein